MGALNDVGDYNVHEQPDPAGRAGPPGPQGPPGPPEPQGLAGRGLLLDDDGNPDFAGKRLTEVGEPEDEGDAVTKSFLEDQFTPVMMTRNVFSQGISMQGEELKGSQIR